MIKSIKIKLMFLSILPVLITILLIGFFSIKLSLDNSNKSLKEFEQTIIHEKEELLKNEILTVKTMIAGIIKSENNIEKAKEKTIELLSSIRFLNGSGYFFAYEKKGNDYYFAFHGTKSRLNGKKTNILKPDIKGYVFRKALIDSRNDDNKFITYSYKKPKTDKIIPKLAFAKEIPEFSWTIVTGIYIDDINKKIDILKAQNKEHMNDFIKLILLISLVLLIIFTITAIIYAKKMIFTPLITFQDGLLGFFKYLNNESSDVKYLEILSDDEIGRMSQTVNENIKKTKKIIEEDKNVINEVTFLVGEISKGTLSGRIKSNSSNPSVSKLVNVLNEMMESLQNIIEHSLDVLKHYQNNDFTQVTSINCQGEICELMKGIDGLGQTITKMLIENKKNGLILDTSAYSLLTNVDILNKASQEGASSLEETAAALEQMTQNIKANVHSISDMTTLAHNLNDSAKQGQELANQTTSSMDEINEQVSLINESISIIDQIAFQTNILSLNAAVEAATAGEAGKGFAVVAAEVRNLANRSADAANEIKSLVEKANEKTNEGKKISDKMITGYTTLNKNIQNTIVLIDEISTASKEQQSAIVQINDAVASLDRQTQSNVEIATKTKDIANRTKEIALTVVQRANDKKFIGKDNIRIDS